MWQACSFKNRSFLTGHKKSGWRVRLPTTGLTRLGIPPLEQMQKLALAKINSKAENEEHRQECLCYFYAVNELPQPQFLAALGF
jgi:hypothetical protein